MAFTEYGVCSFGAGLESVSQKTRLRTSLVRTNIGRMLIILIFPVSDYAQIARGVDVYLIMKNDKHQQFIPPLSRLTLAGEIRMTSSLHDVLTCQHSCPHQGRLVFGWKLVNL